MGHPQKELVDAIYTLLVAESTVTNLIPATRIKKWLPEADYDTMIKPFINIKPDENIRANEYAAHRKTTELIQLHLIEDSQKQLDTLGIFTRLDTIMDALYATPRPTVVSGDAAFLQGVTSAFTEDTEKFTKTWEAELSYTYKQDKA